MSDLGDDEISEAFLDGEEKKSNNKKATTTIDSGKYIPGEDDADQADIEDENKDESPEEKQNDDLSAIEEEQEDLSDELERSDKAENEVESTKDVEEEEKWDKRSVGEEEFNKLQGEHSNDDGWKFETKKTTSEVPVKGIDERINTIRSRIEELEKMENLDPKLEELTKTRDRLLTEISEGDPTPEEWKLENKLEEISKKISNPPSSNEDDDLDRQIANLEEEIGKKHNELPNKNEDDDLDRQIANLEEEISEQNKALSNLPVIEEQNSITGGIKSLEELNELRKRVNAAYKIAKNVSNNPNSADKEYVDVAKNIVGNKEVKEQLDLLASTWDEMEKGGKKPNFQEVVNRAGVNPEGLGNRANACIGLANIVDTGVTIKNAQTACDRTIDNVTEIENNLKNKNYNKTNDYKINVPKKDKFGRPVTIQKEFSDYVNESPLIFNTEKKTAEDRKGTLEDTNNQVKQNIIPYLNSFNTGSDIEGEDLSKSINQNFKSTIKSATESDLRWGRGNEFYRRDASCKINPKYVGATSLDTKQQNNCENHLKDSINKKLDESPYLDEEDKNRISAMLKKTKSMKNDFDRMNAVNLCNQYAEILEQEKKDADLNNKINQVSEALHGKKYTEMLKYSVNKYSMPSIGRSGNILNNLVGTSVSIKNFNSNELDKLRQQRKVIRQQIQNRKKAIETYFLDDLSNQDKVRTVRNNTTGTDVYLRWQSQVSHLFDDLDNEVNKNLQQTLDIDKIQVVSNKAERDGVEQKRGDIQTKIGAFNDELDRVKDNKRKNKEKENNLNVEIIGLESRLRELKNKKSKREKDKNTQVEQLKTEYRNIEEAIRVREAKVGKKTENQRLLTETETQLKELEQQKRDRDTEKEQLGKQLEELEKNRTKPITTREYFVYQKIENTKDRGVNINTDEGDPLVEEEEEVGSEHSEEEENVGLLSEPPAKETKSNDDEDDSDGEEEDGVDNNSKKVIIGLDGESGDGYEGNNNRNTQISDIDHIGNLYLRLATIDPNNPDLSAQSAIYVSNIEEENRNLVDGQMTRLAEGESLDTIMNEAVGNNWMNFVPADVRNFVNTHRNQNISQLLINGTLNQEHVRSILTSVNNDIGRSIGQQLSELDVETYNANLINNTESSHENVITTTYLQANNQNIILSRESVRDGGNNLQNEIEPITQQINETNRDLTYEQQATNIITAHPEHTQTMANRINYNERIHRYEGSHLTTGNNLNPSDLSESYVRATEAAGVYVDYGTFEIKKLNENEKDGPATVTFGQYESGSEITYISNDGPFNTLGFAKRSGCYKGNLDAFLCSSEDNSQNIGKGAESQIASIDEKFKSKDGRTLDQMTPKEREQFIRNTAATKGSFRGAYPPATFKHYIMHSNDPEAVNKMISAVEANLSKLDNPKLSQEEIKTKCDQLRKAGVEAQNERINFIQSHQELSQNPTYQKYVQAVEKKGKREEQQQTEKQGKQQQTAQQQSQQPYVSQTTASQNIIPNPYPKAPVPAIPGSKPRSRVNLFNKKSSSPTIN